MAKIRIKGRDEEIIVDNEKARKIKQRWLGDPTNHIPKAERSDILDLGEWSGEYGSLRTIELDRSTTVAHNEPQPDDVTKLEQGMAKFKQERRAGHLQSRFDLYLESCGVIRFDEFGSLVVRDPAGLSYLNKCLSVLEKRNYGKNAELRQLDAMAPAEEEVTPEKLPITSRTCIMCPTKLTGTLKHYCSGSCLGKAKERGIYGREEEHLETLNAIA